MNTWKTKYFGDNRFNFYGWIIAVLGICVVLIVLCVISLREVFSALHENALHSPESRLLLAIFAILAAILFVLLGIFCIACQNYFARVAKTIEEQDKKKNEPVRLT
jgi:uncharacterized membrane protein